MKTVHFFDLGLERAGQPIADCPPGFWDRLHQMVCDRPDDRRRMIYRGSDYWGRAAVGREIAIPYIYVGKARNHVDWPHFADHQHDLDVLPFDPELTDLIEPAYLAPVPRTNVIAMVRSSAGPSTNAIEHWINDAMNMIEGDQSIVLRPYLRRDALEKLARAQGAAKLTAKFEAGELLDGHAGTQMEQGMSQIQASLGGGASVEMTVSFGRATPAVEEAGELAAVINAILRNGNPSHAVATLLTPDDDGGLKRDHVNFMRDKYTTQVAVGVDQAAPLTREFMLTALRDGIANFRRDLQ